MDHKIYIKGKAQPTLWILNPWSMFNPREVQQSGNPVVAAATAANHGRLQKMPCVPALTMPWLQGKTDERVDGFPALLNNSCHMCMWCGRITIKDDGQKVAGRTGQWP